MQGIPNRHTQSDRGAAAVEFALVLPVLLIVVFGIVQYGWTFYQVQETAYAVREGARVAAVGTANKQGVETLVQGKIPSGASTPTVTVCFTDATPDGINVGDEILVRATHNATDFNLPFLPFPSPLVINQDARTRTENATSNSKTYPACAPMTP